MDTKKVEEMITKGGVNFSEIEENRGNFITSGYQISSSTCGCKFFLNSDIKISQDNKNIELSFKETKENNNIKSNCILSSQNDKKIICNLNKEINSTYKLEPYSFCDNNELITISQDNNDNLPLECNLTTETQTDIICFIYINNFN